MAPLPSLAQVVDEKYVRFLTEVKPDELAPQLGRVVRDLLAGWDQDRVNRAISFIGSTVLTKTFREVLKQVFGALRSNGAYAAWLNLDMGSGKTHLLTLVTYLLAGYEYLREVLDAYRELGLDEGAVARTALFVVDLRTPSETPTTFLPFFASSLSKVGEFEAARYVEECARMGRMPQASELVGRLRRGDTRLVVVVDELHHAVFTYRGTEADRRWVEGVVKFVIHAINYLRQHGRGFAVLVASARRDYEHVSQLHTKDELVMLAESLVEQIGRLESLTGTEWLSVEDAREIIRRWLGARRRDVIHESFNGFIERVIKAQSDIPQAQHLRSLIKAMAAFTLNALERGHAVVTPAAFGANVIDALFPEGDGVAESYKSNYERVKDVIERLGEDPEVREVARMIVNTIFTASITGRPEQIIEIIRAYKFGTYRGNLPAVSELEIKRVLNDAGVADDYAIMRALELVANLDCVHAVRRADSYVYFVVPIPSVVAAYNRLISERYGALLADRDELLDRFVSYLHMMADSVDERSQVVVVGSYEELEGVTKRLNPNVMYLVIYAERGLIKHLEARVRTAREISVGVEVGEYMRRSGRRDLSDWLGEHMRSNVAILVPVPYEDALRGIARYCAIEEATGKVVQEYLLEYLRAESGLRQEVRKLIELELDEIHRALGERFAEAVNSFVAACSRALSSVYVYRCSYEPQAGIRCDAQLESVGQVSVGRFAPLPVREPSARVYSSLVERLDECRRANVRELLARLVERVKSLANFVDDSGSARTIVLESVLESLRSTGRCELSGDMNTFPHRGQLVYVPPSVVAEVAESISVDDLRRRLGEQLDVERRRDGGRLVFEVAMRPAPAVREAGVPADREAGEEPRLAGRREADPVERALAAMDASDRGEVHLVLGFDRSSRSTLKTYINSLRRYIRSIEVRLS